MTSAPVEELLALCRRHVDPAAQAIAIHPGHDGTSILRATANGRDVVVKVHRSAEHHRQEIHAYQHWTQVLGDRAPELLAVIDEPPGIVLTCLPGTRLDQAELSPEQEANAYHQAGGLLRRYHDAAAPSLEPNITIWLAERGEHWLERGRDFVGVTEAAELRAHLRELVELGPLPAVPCHLDFMPRNLLISTTGELSVIDFEHSRYDLAARDLVRPATRIWASRPDLKDAFLTSYRPLVDLDTRIIEHCRFLDQFTARVQAGAGG